LGLFVEFFCGCTQRKSIGEVGGFENVSPEPMLF
jgi:hypothetical protein